MNPRTNFALVSIFFILFASSACSIRKSTSIEINLEESDHTLVLTQLFKGDTIIKKSAVGLIVDNTEIFNGFTIEKIEESSIEERWEP